MITMVALLLPFITDISNSTVSTAVVVSIQKYPCHDFTIWSGEAGRETTLTAEQERIPLQTIPRHLEIVKHPIANLLMT
jgi:hypothetical protein